MRAFDWAATPLGPVARWPQSLKTCVRIILTSRQPMFVWWGEELINLYNDAYKSIVGGKHPGRSGSPPPWCGARSGTRSARAPSGRCAATRGRTTRRCCSSWSGTATRRRPTTRSRTARCPNERGGTGGILCANTDDTQRIIGERQLAAAARARGAHRRRATARGGLRPGRRALGAPTPRSAVRADLSDRPEARTPSCWRGRPGFAPGHAAAPAPHARSATPAPWPVADVLRDHEPRLSTICQRVGGRCRRAPWERPPRAPSCGRSRRRGRRAAPACWWRALNPFRPFDDDYRSFLGAGRGADRGQHRQRPRLRGRAPARRGARRARPREDHVLLERQPRVPHAAHADARAARGRAGVARDARSAGESLEARPPQHAAPAEAGQHPARLLAHRGGPRAGASYEPTDLAALTADLASAFRSAVERGGVRVRRRLPAAAGAGLRRSGHVGEDRPQPALERLQVHARGRDRASRCARAGGRVELRVTRHGRRASPTHELPRLFERFHRVEDARGAHARGLGHRPRAGAGAGQAARRRDRASRATSARARRSRSSIPLGRAHLPADRVARRRRGAGVDGARRQPVRRGGAALAAGDAAAATSTAPGRRRRAAAPASRRRARARRRRQRRHARLPGAPAARRTGT